MMVLWNSDLYYTAAWYGIHRSRDLHMFCVGVVYLQSDGLLFSLWDWESGYVV